MSKSLDRRTFLRKGGEGLLAASAVGLGGVGLSACGGSSPHGSGPPTTLGPSGVTDHKAPRRGGTMTIGTWSEVNGLSPPTARWDATGYLYGNAIFDTLVQVGADGKAHPYLARSISHDPDYRVWTFVLRPGVQFHNGEACNAAAVVNSLEAVRSGLVTSQSLKPVEKIEAIGEDTVRITVEHPWPAFPSYMSGQIGYICAPAMLKSPNEGATQPIGTGPFNFVNWTPSNHLTTSRHPGYWQKGYPYVDELVFKPVLDNSARADALSAGTIDIMHCQSPQTIKGYFGNSKFQVINGQLPPRAEPDVDFIMLNLLVPPLNDPDVRKALAMSINKADLLATFGAGLSTPVTSPFVPGELWYTSTNYPKEDPKAAAQLIARYKARTGNTPEIKLTTIQGPQYLQVVDLVQQNWNSIGVHTSVAQVEFAQFLTEAVVGTYQACTFEQFGATDPDQNYIWWSTDTFAPVNQVSLNMARNRDTRIQNALDKGRQSTNLGDRADAYKSVSKLLAEDLPYLWLGKTYWSAVAANDVVGIMGQSLPDGATSIGFDNGAFLVHELARTK